MVFEYDLIIFYIIMSSNLSFFKGPLEWNLGIEGILNCEGSV